MISNTKNIHLVILMSFAAFQYAGAFDPIVSEKGLTFKGNQFKKEYPAIAASAAKALEDRFNIPEYGEWRRLLEWRAAQRSNLKKFAPESWHLEDLDEKIKNTERAWEETPEYKRTEKARIRWSNTLESLVLDEKLDSTEAERSWQIARKNWLACATSNGLDSSACDEIYDRFADSLNKLLEESFI